MPEKSKIKEKQNQDKTKEESGENKDNKNTEKPEDLEEHVEEIREEIDENKLIEFFQSRENVIPILSKIRTRVPDFNLERDIESTPTKTEQPEPQRTQMNYSSFADEEESRNYQTSQPPVLRPISRGETFQPGLIDPLRGKGIQEDTMQPTMVETGVINQDRRLPFDRDDKKYKEVRFKKFV